MRWLRALLIAVGVVLTVGLLTASRSTAETDCTHRLASSSVKRFASHFGHGRLKRADAAWGAAAEFEWYSTSAPGARLGAEATRRDTLREYFRQRIAQDEHLRITSVKSFYEKRRRIRHFRGNLVRRAADLPPTRFGFKGAWSCRTHKLIVWSMASGQP